MSINKANKKENKAKGKNKAIKKGSVKTQNTLISSDKRDKKELNRTKNDTIEEDENEKLEDKQEKNCDLCNRPRPIFVVDTDDMIKRQPEQHLTPLLRNLKKDFYHKR